MALQYDERIWIIGHFKSPFRGGVRPDWNPARYERLIALLLDRIFGNPVGKLLHEQIVQRIWITPYTMHYGGWQDRNATASSAEWMYWDSRVDYLRHRVCDTLTPWLGDQLMSRAGCQAAPAFQPKGFDYPSPNPKPVGADQMVRFTPESWKPSTSCRDCADPSERRDEVLFHEIFHAVRALLMMHGIVDNYVPDDYLKRTKMNDFEEFCAILVTNYYTMAAGVGRLRRNHGGFKPIHAPGYWTHRWRRATAKFCEQQEDFARSLIPYAKPEYDYDPIGEYFAKKAKKHAKQTQIA